MVDAGLVRTLNFAASLLVLTGLFYLLEAEFRRLSFRWQPVLLVLGVGLVVAEAGLRVFVAGGGTHAVHTVAALLLVLALYDPVENRLRREEWVDLLARDPAIEDAASSLSPVEEAVLGLMARARIVLTPELVAHNLENVDGRPRAALERLADGPFVERADEGRYRITPFGRKYVRERREAGTPP
ncbi:MAG: hypothetical protein ABEJ92_10545 [Halobacteriales archaeon]